MLICIWPPYLIGGMESITRVSRREQADFDPSAAHPFDLSNLPTSFALTVVDKSRAKIMLDHTDHVPNGHSNPIPRPRSLLDLPPEITSVIFRHALVLPVPIQIYCHPDTQSVLFEQGKHDPDAQIRLRDQQLGLPVSLLATCRRIHHEATPILYCENLFEYNPL